MEIIHLSQQQAANMTTFKELIKLYKRKNNPKFEEAIEKNKDRYQFLMDEVLATREISEAA